MWLEVYESLEPVLNLYFSNRSNSFQYLDVKCLHLAQGLKRFIEYGTQNTT